MLQNHRKTLGFKKNMVYKIPPGGGGKPYPASGLCGVHIGFCADPVGVVSPCHHLCSLEGVASVPHIFCKTSDRNIVQASR